MVKISSGDLRLSALGTAEDGLAEDEAGSGDGSACGGTAADEEAGSAGGGTAGGGTAADEEVGTAGGGASS